MLLRCAVSRRVRRQPHRVRPGRRPRSADRRSWSAPISEERLGVILKKLESFETRSTLSSTTSTTRGIGAARQWILDEMKSYSPKLQVSFDTYQVAPQGRITRDVELRNVMAILPGRSPRRIYVSGHYDTVATAGRPGHGRTPARRRDRGAADRAPEDPNAPLDNLAPGVNDDGSGTALTIELARVFSQSGIDFDATLVFMCHVGEEQGLVGARLHAQKAVAEKTADRSGLQQRHRRRRPRRQRHHRRRDDSRLLGRAGRFAVARARAVRPALGRRATCRRTRCG